MYKRQILALVYARVSPQGLRPLSSSSTVTISKRPVDDDEKHLGKNLLHTEEQRTREMLSRLRRLPPDELSVVVEHVAFVRELGGAELHRDELARQDFDGAVVVPAHVL